MTPTPEIPTDMLPPVSGAEIAPKSATAAQLNALKNTIPPAAMEATKAAGAVAQPVMSNIIGTGLAVLGVVGAGVLMYAGMKSVVTGKKPFGKGESLIA